MSRSAMPKDITSQMIATLPTLSAAAFSAARNRRWRPGLSGDARKADDVASQRGASQGEASHGEVFASGRDGAGAAFALALARDHVQHQPAAATDPAEDTRSVLWVQDRQAVRLTGRPYRHGLPVELRHRLICVEANTAEDALFALEEGLRCRDFAFVIGEVAGNPRALDFTASRRLTLAAERYGVPLWLVRIDAARDLSSARMRWDVKSATSPPPRWNSEAPGPASWKAELFRARNHAPGEWMMRDDAGQLHAARPTSGAAAWAAAANAPDHVDLARPTVGRSLAAL